MLQLLLVPRTLLVATSLIAALACTALPGQAQTGKLCWTPGELGDSRSEHTISQNIPAAFRRPPRLQASLLPLLPASRRGAIRRVDLPAGDRRIALTFDLCEQPHEISGYQGDIVDFLRAENIPATFFAGGKWLLTHRRRAGQLMADARFEIANHSWEHRNLRLISGAALATAIDGAQAAYQQTRAALKVSACISPTAIAAGAGHRPAYLAVPEQQRLFRFPFGACNQAALNAVNDRGLMAIQWDVSSADPWRGMSADKMVQHVTQRVRPGSIVLFHANGRGWHTADALPRIIAALRAKGFTFDTVSGLLATEGARIVRSATCYDVRPGDSDRYDALGRKLIERYDAFHTKIGAKPQSR